MLLKKKRVKKRLELESQTENKLKQKYEKYMTLVQHIRTIITLVFAPTFTKYLLCPLSLK